MGTCELWDEAMADGSERAAPMDLRATPRAVHPCGAATNVARVPSTLRDGHQDERGRVICHANLLNAILDARVQLESNLVLHGRPACIWPEATQLARQRHGLHGAAARVR